MVGIDLEDLGFDEHWIVVDINVKDPSTLPDTNIQYCEPEHPSTYVIGPNRHRRWEMMLLPNETPEETLKEENILKLLTRWGEPANFEIRRAAIYRFHALVAQEWRKGRVFLMGDAAHQTPPFMGQGMCQGIRDALNLIWKHGLVERLDNSETLFDSYSLERKPHVKALTEFTIEVGETICMRTLSQLQIETNGLRRIRTAATW